MTRTARARGSFLIRPGYWAPGDRTPRVPRSLAAWRRSIAQMVASRAPLQIIDSLNDWTHGSAIEASRAWPSASGYGAYLDALHVTRPAPSAPAAPPALGPPVPPTLSAAVVSNVLAHQATLSFGASSGTASTTLWVEFTATTTGEVQTTVPTTMAAGSPQHPVSIVVPGLSAAVQYHAHVVASSSVGRISSPDVLFTTLTDAQVMRVAAAGDIACDPAGSLFMGGAGTATACHQVATSNAILAGSYDAVLTLGDQQYNSGTASQFTGSYTPSWGRFVAITHPVVGNHEYGSPGAAAYFQYFGAAAGEPGKGYYSFDVGPWHMIALNSNCAQVNGCGAGSPQELWLRGDLATHPVGCTLAYWHHPRFTSGQHGSDPSTAALWSDLYAGGAELVLSGHDHDYERFAPQSDAAVRDDARGIREFVVGTGGESHTTFKATVQPNSEVRDASSFGFLELTLSDSAYAWKFISDTPGGFSDSGSGSCH